ncbi:MFS transporter [Adlercreutzia murintestinalis]|uniref:MFS transporter n=1 Tax=Adlercreutzia murintestinalis TaxID=2941325 RepID=UPI00203D566B|nr:MFS transporter [Adlercreutzia murintestinalis]
MAGKTALNEGGKAPNREFTITEVVDSLGVTKFTWMLFALLSFALLFDGYDFMIVNSTNLFVAHTFWPGEPNPGLLMGSLTTWGLLGMVIGGAVSGILSDRFGRKKILVAAVIFYGAFTFPQAAANDLAFFAAFRLLAGLGVGSCIPIVYTVFSEEVPSRWRGAFITFGGAFMVGGWVVAGLVANPICNATVPLMGDFTNLVEYALPDGGTSTMYANWRLCYLIGALPVIYGIVLIFAMHETPHWYATAGRKEEAVRALAQIEKRATGVETPRDPQCLIVPPRPEKTTPNILFSNKFIVATCGIWACYFVGQFCVYGMNAWLPAWFVGIGYNSSEAVALQTWNNVAAIVSNSIVGYFSDKMGRKRTLQFGWGLCIVTIVICSLFVAPGNFVLCTGLMLLFGFALNWAISAVVPLMPEQYPTAVRNTGVSWCQAFARFGGSASSIVLGGIAGMAFFQTAQGTTNWSQVVLVLIVPFVLGIVCTALFVRDTSGRSFEALDAEAMEGDNDTGTTKFGIMIAIIVILFALCIVCPLAVPGWSKLPIALPLMATGMLLPFAFFFIFGGSQLAREKRTRA